MKWALLAALFLLALVRPAGAPPTPNDAASGAVAAALSQVGKPYVLGTQGPDTFDCSGLVEWAYAQQGVSTTRTTFTQLEALPAVDPAALQTGDMVYYQFPWDQHTGLLFVGADGEWSMVHAAAPGLGVIVTEDVFHDPFYADAIIGYRRATR